MTKSRFSRTRRIVTLVPLAVVSALATVQIASLGALSTTAAPPVPLSQPAPMAIPAGTQVSSTPLKAPASVSTAAQDVARLPGTTTNVANESTSGIPSAALSAYQRAETVINAADKTCHLSWQLVAAIGRVESNHGRYGGNVLGDDGVARPGIYGIPLNGKNNTAAIRDTDAGQFDNDQVWDRAVGPMQFIPSTWSVVGVDADGDGVRNPQDIDDAALASAVYLCSGNDDLSTNAGQRAAVYRYNHSSAYVDLVLSIMNAYLDGEFTSTPNGTVAPVDFTTQTLLSASTPIDALGETGTDYQPAPVDPEPEGQAIAAPPMPGEGTVQPPVNPTTPPVSPSTPPTPTTPPATTTPPTTPPTSPPTSGSPTGSPTGPVAPSPTDSTPTDDAESPDPTPTDSPSTAISPAAQVLSIIAATTECTSLGLTEGTPAFKACLADLI